ncbi:MAG: 4-hydroxythreonine-4-phosphate dehydrogenase PdxA [Acidobacteria bacterium]|nr:MAG: 4-hydroxythreonine-4-phosphate dehydrogenase PdxA [Acidobacteriota bacterium]REJ99542.1 MAG: 4-hydroxythreonine-4-phosphate dehydrogenase PdxA [Acidobacteriota bacterium]
MGDKPILALTQGDPAGVGPEILAGVLADWASGAAWIPLLICEGSALEALEALPAVARLRARLHAVEAEADRPEALVQARAAAARGAVPWIDPAPRSRVVRPGRPGGEDARGAIAALDRGLELAQGGHVAALVTAPLSKRLIAEHVDPSFRGHTDYLARRAGLREYGSDYLMAFLGQELQVALLSTHISLREALQRVEESRIVEALRCMHRSGARRIAVAGLNPHAGEDGLLGSEDDEIVRPAVMRAVAEGVEASGPVSPDTVFHRCRRGEFDWVLALYHDQGLIAVKTISFGGATNWTMGLPYLRTSPDHGTAYELAGRGLASSEPMREVIGRTLAMLTARSQSG